MSTTPGTEPQFDLDQFIDNNGRIESPVVTDDTKVNEIVEDVTPPEVVNGEEVDGNKASATEEASTTEAADDLDEALKAISGGGTQKPAWDDKNKELFKSTFGSDNPEAFLQEYNTLKETVAQATKDGDAAKRVLDRAGKLPYELSQAVQAALNGKDYSSHLKELASGVTLSKASKDIDKFALVDKHYAGKFTAEQKEALKEGSADEELQERFKDYHERSAEKHDDLRKKEQGNITAAQQQQKEIQEADKKSALEAVAFAKNDPVASRLINQLPPETTDEYLSGALEDRLLYNADGTRRKEALALLAKGLLFDKAVARAIQGAQANGRNEAGAKKHAELPKVPAPANGRQPVAKSQKEGPKLHPDIQKVLDEV